MAAETFRLTALLLSVGLTISFLEQIANRRHLPGDGVLSWRVLRLAHGDGARAHGGRGPLAVVLDHPGVLVVLAVHGAALGAMIVSVAVGTFVPLVQATLLATLMVTAFRNRYSLDGADQMAMIVAAALFAYSLAPEDRLIAQAALWFVALQAVLSYLAAGLGKLAGPAWRSGRALCQVVNTRTYGTRWMARLLHDRPFLSRALSWNVIGFQILFPAALLLDPPGTAVFLAWGLAFHGGSVLVMGLHRFFWAFAATYPAIWLCARSI